MSDEKQTDDTIELKSLLQELANQALLPPALPDSELVGFMIDEVIRRTVANALAITHEQERLRRFTRLRRRMSSFDNGILLFEHFDAMVKGSELMLGTLVARQGLFEKARYFLETIPRNAMA